MRLVLEVVAPVFLVVALGWLAARRGAVDAGGFRGLNAFAFGLATPSLLFLGGTTGPAGGGAAAAAFFLGTAVLYGATLLLARQRLPAERAGMLALDASFGNTVMMGIPLVTAAFGPEALAVLLAILALHSLLLLGVATVVAELALHQGAGAARMLRATALGVLRNPIVMAVGAALLWRLLDLPPPPPMLRRTLEMLGAAGPPVALFCLGGSLAGFDARGLWRETALACALKLLAMPALVFAASRLVGLPPFETAVTVVVAAMPTGANAYLLAQRYRIAPERSGAAVLVGTLASVATLSGLLAWFRG